MIEAMSNITWIWGPRFKSHLEPALRLLQAPAAHIAVDGGALVRESIQVRFIASWLAVGDGDSGAETDLLDHVFDQDKDASDLGLALQYVDKSTTHLQAYGFSGGRPDHQMIVFGCFYRHLQQTQQQILLDQNWLLLAPGQWQGTIAAGTCSIITLEPTQLTLSGDWRWPLQNYQSRPLDDRLLSNQSGGRELKISHDHPLFLWSEKPITQWWQRL